VVEATDLGSCPVEGFDVSHVVLSDYTTSYSQLGSTLSASPGGISKHVPFLTGVVQAHGNRAGSYSPVNSCTTRMFSYRSLQHVVSAVDHNILLLVQAFLPRIHTHTHTHTFTLHFPRVRATKVRPEL
jgi:hypothetical protein